MFVIAGTPGYKAGSLPVIDYYLLKTWLHSLYCKFIFPNVIIFIIINYIFVYFAF